MIRNINTNLKNKRKVFNMEPYDQEQYKEPACKRKGALQK